MVKSTWPGVSMMLMRWSRQKQVVAADVMVMPRSCSCSIQSMVGGAFMDLADLVGPAGVKRMRSVVVVLPASMCAMMPMLR